MRITIERLRTGILALAAVLVAAIVLFFVYARWRVRHVGRDLPAKLGIEVQQSTNGFTLSKSEAGRTLFTIHASKAVQYKGAGRAILHDVSITLYGKDGASADHIAGKDFEYDPSTGAARALGDVEIDLAPPANGRKAKPKPLEMRTSGLVFQQKTGVATTPGPVEFSFSAASGSAKGATYDSQRGLLTLESEVVFRSQINGNPLLVRAGNAQFNRAGRQLALLHDAADYNGDHTTSDQALITFRPDGTAERINAQGQVHVMGEGGRSLRSSTAEVQLNAQGQPELATLDGGLLFHMRRGDHDIHGDAVRGALRMGDRGALEHLHLEDAADVVDQESPMPGNPRGSLTRQVLASRLDIDFAQSPDGRAEPKAVLADGGATVEEHVILADRPSEDTRIQGNQLFATLRDGAMESLRGTGDTVLTRTNPNGVVETSSGDSLDVTFAPRADTTAGALAGGSGQGARKSGKGSRRSQGAAGGRNDAGQIERAVQRGHVQVVQAAPAANGKPASRSTATAEEADYDGKTETLLLHGGSPQLTEEDADVAASAITFSRVTGNATAAGDVKVTYRQSPAATAPKSAPAQQGPAHVAAAEAYFDHARDTVTFNGGDTVARLWQGDSSISAPRIVLSRKLQTLTASAAPGGGSEAGDGAAHASGSEAAVHAVFYQPPGSAGPRRGAPALPHRIAQPGSANRGAAAIPPVTRVSAAKMVYSGAEHKAEFLGGVIARQGISEVRADTVDLYLAETSAPKAPGAPVPAPPGGLGGSIDRLVAVGHVLLTEPGRQGTGDHLTYTAADGQWELTGSPARPPRLTDQVQGSVTGNALIFNDRNGSVEVSGGQSQAVTETHAPK